MKPSFRIELYKTQASVYILFLSPEIKLMIQNNTVFIDDFDNKTKIEEIENSESRGYLYIKDCQFTSKYICLFFKKVNVTSVLIISRKNPEVRKSFQMFHHYSFLAHESVILTMEQPRFGRICSGKVILRKLRISDDNELLDFNLKSQDYCLKITKLLDMNKERLLILKFGVNAYCKYVTILSLNDHEIENALFTMPYSHPSVLKLYKHFLIIMTLNDGHLRIIDTIFNEENPLFSQRFEKANAETLIVNYGKIIFCEQNQVNILYLNTLEDEHKRTGIIGNNYCSPLKSNFDVIARIIKLDSIGFVEHIRLKPDAIWLNCCDGIIRERTIIKFW